MKKIAFIGGGNMAEAIIGGLIKSNKNYSIGVFEPNMERMTFLKNAFSSLNAYTSNSELLQDKQDIIILAVKPQVIDKVLSEISNTPEQTIVLSIAAGIPVSKIKAYCKNAKIVRCMPNTPFLVGAGTGGICFDQKISAQEKLIIIDLFFNCGKLIEVQEEHMHAVTALSGSGPAYFFHFVELLVSAAIKLGLDPNIAKELAVATAFGSGKLLMESKEEPAILRQKVTSPNGTTEAALNSFLKNDLKGIVEKALQAANDRSVELAN